MRRSAAVIGATLVACGLLVFGSASAVAAYKVAGTFANTGPEAGGWGSGNGEISNANQIDVNDATGNLYVADTGNDRVQVFKPLPAGGEYDSQLNLTDPTGLAIDQDGGDVYVATPAGISKFTAGLTPAAGWTAPSVTGAPAVDPSSGDLLVADTAGNQILRFNSDGSADGSFAAERPVDVAANSAGDVFVVTTDGDIVGPPCGTTSAVERFSGAGVSEGELPSLTVPGSVAVDPDDDSVVVATKVNEYFCEQQQQPEVVFFEADGTFAEAVLLPQNTYWAAVPGLTAQGGESSRVYALTRSPLNNQYGATGIHLLLAEVLPAATIAAADAVTPTGARLSGTIDPEGFPATFQFEYRVKGEAGWSPASGGSGSAGAGTDPEERQVTLSGLPRNTAFEARLSATNIFGTVTTASIEFMTLATVPVVQALPAAQIGADSAILRAKIDPAGQATTYHFEYGVDTGYGSTLPASGSRNAGADNGPRVVIAQASGLQPGTTYHYRVVAVNATGKSEGEDRSFTTTTRCGNEAIRERQGSQFLPECRAYEMVSPPDKHGYDVSGLEHTEYDGEDFTPLTSATGDAVAFTSHGTFAGIPSHTTYGTFLADRGADGWTTEPLTPYVDYQTAMIPFQAFSDDLRSWFVRGPMRPQLNGEASGEVVQNGWIFDGASQRYELTTPGLQRSLDLLIADPKVDFADWSADRQRIFVNILKGPVGDPRAWLLYEWDRSAQQLRNVGGVPGVDLPADADVVIASPDINFGGRDEDERQWNPVSEDGSTVFYYLQDLLNDSAEVYEPQLYVELNGNTVQHVSESQRTVPDPNGTKPATYHFASTDGDVAFFSSAEKLTDDATTGPSSGGRDLYRYEVATEELTDITVDGTSPNGAEVQGVIGGSDDGERVYFVARADLAPGAVAGENNLYAWIDDGTPKGEIQFVSVGIDEENWKGIFKPGDPIRRTARVLPDGMHVMFTSKESLLGHESNGHRQVYLYDAAANDLACASCDPSGAVKADAFPVGTGDRVELARSLSEDGRFIFFTTAQGLVPRDVNTVADVYRYDAANDRIDLLSPGSGPFAAEFQDASADGSSVYITTRQPLLSSDLDANVDVYGARIDGGFLSQSPAPPPAPCVGEACRPEPAAPPPSPGEASAILRGQGNAAGRRAKPKQQRGKCAKARKKKTGKKGKKKACAAKKRGQR